MRLKTNKKAALNWGYSFLLLLLPCVATADSSQAEKDWENYWPSDQTDAVFDAINDGELNFLEHPPDKPVHNHHNTLVFQPYSIESGWLKLRQCHEHLDVFNQVQIVYREAGIRNLRILEYSNIGQAHVEGHTIQLTDVQPDAMICLEAESKVLTKQEDGTYIIQNGPFMRKFFDGYFPMRVTLDIQLPDELKFVEINPAQQQGFKVIEANNQLHLDAWFEGKLVTRIRLKDVRR